MYTATPNSTQLLQELTHQPIFERAIDEQLKREPFFESQDFNRLPVAPRQRVSEKLLENRLRRIEINMQKQQQIDNLLEKKRAKEREISTNIRNRLDRANKKKQENLRQSYSQQENRRKGEQLQSRQKLRRFQANLQKIEKGRQKVEEKKSEYIFRIHRRTEENLRKVNEKRKLMQTLEEAENDQIHLQEWNTYKEKLLRKHQGKGKSPPDRLYQDFKQRNQKFKDILSKTIEQDAEQPEPIKVTGCREAAMLSSVSAKSLLTSSRKAQYFGIHEQNMISKTIKQIEKMRKFLQNEGSVQTFMQNEEVLENFKCFLNLEILHK